MNNKIKRSRFAQGRIDYIVYGNPKGVSQMVVNLGYEPGGDLHDLVDTVHRLIKRKGRKVVKELVKLHPDRAVILRTERLKQDSYCAACSSYAYNGEDNYCGVCGHSSYDGTSDKGDFLDQLAMMGARELEVYYENLLKKGGKTPKDTNLAEEIQMVWTELRKRKQEDTPEDKSAESQREETNNYKDELIVGSILLIVGVLIGTSKLFKSSSST